MCAGRESKQLRFYTSLMTTADSRNFILSKTEELKGTAYQRNCPWMSDQSTSAVTQVSEESSDRALKKHFQNKYIVMSDQSMFVVKLVVQITKCMDSKQLLSLLHGLNW